MFKVVEYFLYSNHKLYNPNNNSQITEEVDVGVNPFSRNKKINIKK